MTVGLVHSDIFIFDLKLPNEHLKSNYTQCYVTSEMKMFIGYPLQP